MANKTHENKHFFSTIYLLANARPVAYTLSRILLTLLNIIKSDTIDRYTLALAPSSIRIC